jgi:hypothetical protein
MTISAAPKGQVFRLQTSVQTNSTYQMPTAVLLYIIDPLGTSTTYSSSQMSSTGTGFYYYDYTIPREGMFYYKWVTTGNGAGAISGQFRGLDTPFDS